MIGSVQSWVGSQFHLHEVETYGCWGGYRGQVGSITACLPFSHAVQLPKVRIPLRTTELDPCQDRCEGTAFKIHTGPNCLMCLVIECLLVISIKICNLLTTSLTIVQIPSDSKKIKRTMAFFFFPRSELLWERRNKAATR